MNQLITSPQPALTASQDIWSQAVEAWLSAKYNRRKSHNTRRAYRRAITDWLSFVSEMGIDPGKVGGVIVEAFKKSLADSGKAQATIAQRLAAVSSFYLYCSKSFTLTDLATGNEIALVSYNPVDRAERPQVDAFAGAQKITVSDVKQVLDSIDTSMLTGRRNRSIMLAYLMTGRRLTELAALCWRDFNFHGDSVAYTYIGKGNKKQTRQLPPPVWEAISDYLIDSGRLSTMDADSPLWVAHSDVAARLPNVDGTNTGKPLAVSTIRKIVNSYTKKALGRKVSPHALRHAAALLRREAGSDVKQVQEFLDHSSLATTERYLMKIETTTDENWQGVAKILAL